LLRDNGIGGIPRFPARRNHGGMLRLLRGGGNAKGFARRRCGRLGSAAHGQSKATSEKEDSEA
jgi:hypothetical protein